MLSFSVFLMYSCNHLHDSGHYKNEPYERYFLRRNTRREFLVCVSVGLLVIFSGLGCANDYKLLMCR